MVRIALSVQVNSSLLSDLTAGKSWMCKRRCALNWTELCSALRFCRRFWSTYSSAHDGAPGNVHWARLGCTAFRWLTNSYRTTAKRASASSRSVLLLFSCIRRFFLARVYKLCAQSLVVCIQKPQRICSSNHSSRLSSSSSLTASSLKVLDQRNIRVVAQMIIRVLASHRNLQFPAQGNLFCVRPFFRYSLSCFLTYSTAPQVHLIRWVLFVRQS